MKSFFLPVAIGISGLLLAHFIAEGMASGLEVTFSVPPRVTYLTTFAGLICFTLQMARKAHGEAVGLGWAIESSIILGVFGAVVAASRVNFLVTAILATLLVAYLLIRQWPKAHQRFASKSDRC